MEKKKVVILSAFLSPMRSGAEACAEEVPLLLADQFDFTIVTARMRSDLPTRDMLQGKIPVIRVGFGCTFDKWLYPFLAPLAVRKLKPDVVHAILETFAGLALVFCKAPKKILTCQTTNRMFLKGIIVRSPDVVTAISNYLSGIIRAKGRSDVVIIPNGIPLQEIRNIAHNQTKIPSRILFVGRIETMKGVDTLLDAMRILHHTDVHIVGDGSQLQRLQLGSASILPEHVFKGSLRKKDLYEEYAAAGIFCGLSKSEAFGNVFLEAQAAGCVVVATDVGGITEIVKDGETGILVPSNDPSKAADAIRKLLNDTNLRNRMSVHAIENAQHYDWSGIAKKYAALYR